jgi:transcriptional/translational regulatory protein YebC/TACO1
LQRIPTTSKILDIDKSKSVLKMIDKFEEDEDVQQVFHNMELTEEILTAMDSE